MLSVTTRPAPGLSAVADLPLGIADLHTPRYRRWLDRLQGLAQASAGARCAARPTATDRESPVPAAPSPSIGLPSAASGTLSRLP